MSDLLDDVAGLMARVAQLERERQPSVTPPLAALPSSPIGGQVATILVSASPRIEWTFVYRPDAAGPYRWIALGDQVSLYSADENDRLLGAVVSFTTWAQAPTLTTPLDGEYRVTINGGQRNDAATQSWLAPKFGAAAASDADARISYTGAWQQGEYTITRTIAAATALVLYGRASSGSLYLGCTSLEIRPVKVG